jgi:hypothetical protein
MSQPHRKIDIFKKFSINSNKIVGRIIDINYKKQTARFWVQEPTYLKNKLMQGRHTPNIFYFHNLKDRDYSPKIGDMITANITIPNNTLLFYNITKKNKLSKTKRNNNIINKRLNTKRFNNRKPRSRRQRWSKKKKIRTPKKKTPTPRVFMLLGHSYECVLEHSIINPKVYELLSSKYKRLIGYHEDISNNSPTSKTPQHLFFKEVEEMIITVDAGMTEWLWSTSDNIIDNSPEPAVYFNKTRFDNNQTGFLCGKECSNFFGKDELILLFGDIEKLALVEDPGRIDLKNDFSDILPNNKIKFLNGQSTGRAGLIATSFNIMEFMQEREDFRQLIYNSKDMGDMAELDRYLNMLNIYYKYHRDYKDTDFAIYPRINQNGYEVNGPKDTNISFNPSPDTNGNYINGDVWPLGIFELPMFDTSFSRFRESSLKYNTLFKNYSGSIIADNVTPYPEWEFFSAIKNTSPSDITNRALLLKMPESKPSPEKELLDSLDSDIQTITKYNTFLVSKMKTSTYFNPNKEFKLSELIRNTIRLADIKPAEEVIFITNICRVVKFPGYREKYMTNQLSDNRQNRTVPETTRKRINSFRRNSRGL